VAVKVRAPLSHSAAKEFRLFKRVSSPNAWSASHVWSGVSRRTLNAYNSLGYVSSEWNFNWELNCLLK
jgi:hypothetical protein